MHDEVEYSTCLVAEKAATTRRSLVMDEGLEFEEWRSIGKVLATLSDASRWWLGDWLIYGESSYPSRYREAADQTTLGYQTLRNYAWVARSFRPPERWGDLSFQHHSEVASLDPEARSRWLSRASRFRWTRNVLRNRLRASRRAEVEEAPTSVRLAVDVPDGQHRRWQDAADEARLSLEDWIVATLDKAATRDAWSMAATA